MISCRQYRHIPLVGLGNVLHRLGIHYDAAMDAAHVLHMAIDHKMSLLPAQVGIK